MPGTYTSTKIKTIIDYSLLKTLNFNVRPKFNPNKNAGRGGGGVSSSTSLVFPGKKKLKSPTSSQPVTDALEGQ